MSKDKNRKNTGIVLGGVTGNVVIKNNVVKGGNLLDASTASIRKIEISGNHASGGDVPIRLGDVLELDISDNILEIAIPREVAAEIAEAAKNKEDRNTFTKRIMNKFGKLMSPSEIDAIINLWLKIYPLIPS